MSSGGHELSPSAKLKLASSSVGRRLYGTPTLWQDWGEEAESGEVGYWELFTDLLMVAAATSIADTLKDLPTLEGFIEFTLLYSAIVNSWLLYTHHYTSRFNESSLVHTMILFLYLIGMAISIANAGVDTKYFSLGTIIQRVAFMCMTFPIYNQIPRTQQFIKLLEGWVLVSTACFVGSYFFPESTVYFWIGAFIVDNSIEWGLSYFLPGDKLVPVNIEHSKDRLGVLVLIMLGETVISATITYREFLVEMKEEEEDEEENEEEEEDVESSSEQTSYYVVLCLSFLLIFMVALVFFNVSPPPKHHAFRRSRTHGVILILLNKILGLTLLSLGVAIKTIVEAVATGEDQDMPDNLRLLLGLSVGATMINLFASRADHYLGKRPQPTDPLYVKRLMYLWWSIFAVFGILPFCFLYVTTTVTALAIYSGLLLTFTIIETIFTHVLENYLPKEDEEEEEEQTSLLRQDISTSYQSTN